MQINWGIMKKRLAIFACMLMLLSVTLPSTYFAAEIKSSEKILEIDNFDFEEPASEEGNIPEWTQIFGTDGILVDNTKSFSGENSLRLEDASSSGNVGIISKSVSASPGKEYRVSAKTLSETSGNAEIYLRFFDGNGKYITSYNEVKKGPTLTWEDITLTAVAPDNTAEVAVLFYSGKGNVGTYYFDSVQLIESEVEPTQPEITDFPVVNGGFEDYLVDGAIPGWSKDGSSNSDNFGVTDEKSFKGSKSLIIENEPDKYMLVRSDFIEINPSDTYTAIADVFLEYGSVDMYVRFYDENGKYTGDFEWNKLTSPTNEWTKNMVTATAPENATKLAILFAGSNSKTYKHYVDEVQVVKGIVELPEEEIVNPIEEVGMDLGVQVSKTTVMLGDIGKDANGRDVLYTVVAGAPSKLAIVDIETEKLVNSYPLEDTSGAWAVTVAADGTVYLGAYNKGYLYRYFPKTDTLENLGYPVVSTDPVLYPIDIASNGKIYGGTYGSGSVYQYDPDTKEFTSFGTMVQGQQWVRSVAYDESTNKVYAGIGSVAHLIEYDINTGKKNNILPEQFSDIISVYDLDLVDGKLFAQKESSYEMFVLDTKTKEVIKATNGDTGEVVENIPESSRGVSAKSPIANKIYFTHYGILYEYDLDSNTFKSLNVDIQGSAISYEFLQLNEEGFPGYSLVGLSGNGGKLYKYNLETGKLKLVDLELPAEPVLIHELAKGPDGKIYSTGYLPGNMGVYLPSSDKNIRLDGIGQGEGMASLNGNLYLGVYPNARIYEYDLSSPWNRTDSNKLNPDTLFSLETNTKIEGYTPQDRPFAMLGVEDYNKLFIGTVPKNGHLGGAFAIYDVVEKGDPKVYWNIMPDQSIVSLTYKDGKVYGGTTVAGGQGSEPTTTEAKLFIWDIESGEKTFETVPVPNRQAITALTIGHDGNVWGMANGTIFTFDPETKEVIYSKDIYPEAANRWREAQLEIGTDGNIYGIAAGKFFKFDVTSKEVSLLASKVEHMTQDDFGAFYISNGNHLYKYSDEKLLVDLTGATITVKETKITAGERIPLNIHAQLENQRSTFELSGAKVEYEISNEKIISVENGEITALKSGASKITATITLNGKVVKTNTIKIQVNNKYGESGK
ncbi:carbohydrate binding domain-containing protein [Bacillus sp. REN16]|uniref:carbohydrate binding domain-containing protein n=1 Tax=Bacillus sp. REN16 TaxID=2887296 RepID=UPI001E3285BB|nr:carbohydrate binding domain-containing protein [Bacillus sp. REN16]MCC3357168.1 carbohydrate binding domain-containing protein [Bacillus sp. REN16]